LFDLILAPAERSERKLPFQIGAQNALSRLFDLIFAPAELSERKLPFRIGAQNALCRQISSERSYGLVRVPQLTLAFRKRANSLLAQNEQM
jgi:hypothetical protein